MNSMATINFNLDDFLTGDPRRRAKLSRVLHTAAAIIDEKDVRLGELIDHAGMVRLANTAAALWLAMTDVLMESDSPTDAAPQFNPLNPGR